MMDTKPGHPGAGLEPLVRRTFRHPETGHEVALTVDRQPEFGEEPWWRVDAQDTQGSPAWMARLRGVTVVKTRDAARRVFAERQRALRAAGYERVRSD